MLTPSDTVTDKEFLDSSQSLSKVLSPISGSNRLYGICAGFNVSPLVLSCKFKITSFEWKKFNLKENQLTTFIDIIASDRILKFLPIE